MLKKIFKKITKYTMKRPAPTTYHTPTASPPIDGATGDLIEPPNDPTTQWGHKLANIGWEGLTCRTCPHICIAFHVYVFVVVFVHGIGFVCTLYITWAAKIWYSFHFDLISQTQSSTYI